MEGGEGVEVEKVDAKDSFSSKLVMCNFCLRSTPKNYDYEKSLHIEKSRLKRSNDHQIQSLVAEEKRERAEEK